MSKLPINQIICGDCLEEMKKFPNNSIDLVVTDPPYGYSFMGKDWDKVVMPVKYWKECLRVLKSGAFAFVMSAPRQDVLSRAVANLQDAGFETGFTSIYWAYASGFPKAMNIGKMVDKRGGEYMGWFADYLKSELKKRNMVQKDLAKYFPSKTGGLTGCVHNWIEGKNIPTPKQFNKICKVLNLPFDNIKEAEREVIGKDKNWGEKGTTPFVNYGDFDITVPATDQAKALDGSYGGYQPKPAVEVIIVCMKPLSEKTFVDQALANRKGITWLDDCRIPHDEPLIETNRQKNMGQTWNSKSCGLRSNPTNIASASPSGRFPANLLVSDDVLNDGKKQSQGHWAKSKVTGYGENYGGKQEYFGVGEKGTVSSFSRYFDLDKWAQKTFPFLIVPKASKGEKNKGCESLPEKDSFHGSHIGRDLSNPKTHLGGLQDGKAKNIHPTVKPLKLMSYLITLGSRQGDTVLDPFVGSGTTAVSAKYMGRNFIGIEINPEYCKIAEQRLKQETLLDHIK